MPKKSKHGKGRHYRASKKSKSLQRRDTIRSQVSASAEVSKPSAPIPSAPAVKAATPAVSATKTSQYIYVPGDLRRIGILAAIIIIILFALYFVLS